LFQFHFNCAEDSLNVSVTEFGLAQPIVIMLTPNFSLCILRCFYIANAVGINLGLYIMPSLSDSWQLQPLVYTGWSKIAIHYQESSLNRIKKPSVRLDFSSILSIKWAQVHYQLKLS